MKRMACMVPVLLLLLAAGTQAQKPGHEGCPAHQAATQGVTIIEKLHEVMAPAWHTAYPDEDHAALAKAMHDFAAMIPDVKKISHTFKIDDRREKFNAARTKFIDLVKRGAAATTEDDAETVYGLMPDIHVSFEEMAYYLLPLHFPEFESFVVVVEVMTNEHLANEDYEAVATSTEALRIKNLALQDANLPEDLTSLEDKVRTDIAAIGDACGKLEEACAATDNKLIVECLNNLKNLCEKFEQNYI